MNQINPFSIKSVLELQFNTPNIRNISYDSFLPEFSKLQTQRSTVSIDKKNDNKIIFKIESKDITAFRASINEIISYGKIIADSLKLIDNS
jgi:tRNA threonylcarbamoyladenosine modification (KEOPS) complex  Pcc1 subunit